MPDGVRSRRAFALAVVAATGIAAVGARAQVSAPTNSAPNPYHAVENWGKLPEGRTWGSTSGVDIDPDGTSVWVAERCGAFAPPSLMKPGTPFACDGSNLPPILKFDSSGKLLKAFGAGLLLFPHGLHVDSEGNVWVTDGLGKDGKGHQVFKFSPDGRVLMTLGKAGVAGSGPDEFNAPSAVLVAPNGDIFVADGHGGNTNARIVKFTKDGKFIKSWGKKGSGPGELDIPHALAMDSRGRLFVGDRQNNRIQIFDQDGNYIDQWFQFSRPSGVFIDKKDMIYVADSESDLRLPPLAAARPQERRGGPLAAVGQRHLDDVVAEDAPACQPSRERGRRLVGGVGAAQLVGGDDDPHPRRTVSRGALGSILGIAGDDYIWEPTAEALEHAHATAFMREHGIADWRELIRRSQDDVEWFWDAAVRFLGLEFFEPYERVLDTSRGIAWATWFTGGTVNLTHNCVDRHPAEQPGGGVGERGRTGRASHVRRAGRRDEPPGQRPSRAGRRTGRRGRALPPDVH